MLDAVKKNDTGALNYKRVSHYISPRVSNFAMTARDISHHTKGVDTNGMDIFFASDSAKPQKHTTSTIIESLIKKKRFIRGGCNMKNAF